MSATVAEVLEQRLHREPRRAVWRALGAALVLHAVAVTAAWVLPRLQREPARPRIVSVRVVPLQRLGSPTAPPTRPEPWRETAPPPPEPRPQPPETPATPPPEPREPEPQPEEPAQPEPAAPAPPAGRRGSPEGDPSGVSAFGATIAGLEDPSFLYDSYLERMLAMIEEQWVRPPVEGRIEATIFFRVASDGEVTGLQVLVPSGHRAFDLAAVRAVQNAAPLPPLPRSYRQDSLGVNLIVR